MRQYLLALGLLATLVAPASSAAQDRPVVLIHGLNSGSDTWSVAAARLDAALAVQTFRPGLAWTQPYGDQADQLQGQLGWLPSTTIAVGHSNGGIVAREWSKRRPLTGVITLSTPNWGAPLVNHIGDWVGFNFLLYDLFGAVGAAVGGDASTWSWVYPTLATVAAFADGLSVQAITLAGTTLGIQSGLPILPHMAAGSGFLAQLNGGANVQREASSITGRVGIVSIAADYYRGGVIRAIAPEHADAASDYMWAGAALVEGAALQIVASSGNITLAQRLLSVASWLRLHEEYWCRAVSDPAPMQYGRCTPNDSVVPAASQAYPGGVNVEYRNTPVHIQQTTGGADTAIATVLRNTFNVSSRAGGPPPQPQPGSGDTLFPGQRLWPGQSLASTDGHLRLTYQGDGNLVLTRDGTPIWASMTVGVPGYAEMQPDGNFVVYPGDGTSPWATNTDGSPGAVLTVSNDGSVSVYIPGGALLWRAATGS